MKIIRRNIGQGSSSQEQTLSDSGSPHVNKDELLIDRLVYKKLSSLTDNKVLETPVSASDDFKRWLLDMNNLHLHKYYPSLTSGTPIPTPDIVALDEYLGTLGVTDEYPFKDDSYSVEPWIEIEQILQDRVLLDTDDNTYLVDTSDDTVLISTQK
jgi:hypothetical protein